MNKLSTNSKKRLLECHPDLQLLINELAEKIDICVVCGYRGKEDQNKAVREGRSKAPYPTSKHNSKPSLAVDIAPMEGSKIDWANIKRFNEMLDVLQDIADRHGIALRMGRTFSFKDYPHVELKGV